MKALHMNGMLSGYVGELLLVVRLIWHCDVDIFYVCSDGLFLLKNVKW